MKKRVFGGFAAAVLGLFVLGGSVPIAAQSAADPWGRVPAFPTTCYSNDTFFETVGQAIEALDAKALPTHEAIIFAAAADTARFAALQEQLNMDYEKLCVAWWGAAGAFQVWMRSYKTYLVNDIITPNEALTGAVVLQMAIMDTPTGGYRSTALLEGVRNYMEKARGVYNLRPLGKFGNVSAPKR